MLRNSDTESIFERTSSKLWLTESFRQNWGVCSMRSKVRVLLSASITLSIELSPRSLLLPWNGLGRGGMFRGRLPTASRAPPTTSATPWYSLTPTLTNNSISRYSGIEVYQGVKVSMYQGVKVYQGLPQLHQQHPPRLPRRPPRLRGLPDQIWRSRRDFSVLLFCPPDCKFQWNVYLSFNWTKYLRNILIWSITFHSTRQAQS